MDERDSCSECGSDMSWEDCWRCGGAGYHELYDEDPLWYDPDDIEVCQFCGGRGGSRFCPSTTHGVPAEASA